MANTSFGVVDFTFQQTPPTLRAYQLWMYDSRITPAGTGIDLGSVKRLLFNPLTAAPFAPISWTVTDIFARVEGPSAGGNISLTIVRSTGTGVFSAVNNINDTPVLIPAGAFEQLSEPPVINNPLCFSGDKLACQWNALGISASDFTVYLILQANF